MSRAVTVRSQPEDLLTAYAAAVLEQDAAALAALYAEDLRVFDTWGVWSYEGKTAWRPMVEGWLGSLGSERVHVSFDDVRIDVGADRLRRHEGDLAARPDGLRRGRRLRQHIWPAARGRSPVAGCRLRFRHHSSGDIA